MLLCLRRAHFGRGKEFVAATSEAPSDAEASSLSAELSSLGLPISFGKKVRLVGAHARAEAVVAQPAETGFLFLRARRVVRSKGAKPGRRPECRPQIIASPAEVWADPSSGGFVGATEPTARLPQLVSSLGLSISTRCGQLSMVLPLSVRQLPPPPCELNTPTASC